jgi:hypothetical protein
MKGYNWSGGNLSNELIFKEILDVLLRIEGHLLKHEPKKEKPKKQQLND